ncbi:MAG TPA: GatB/YqeY domain-containing protein [Chloroflexota bacterium]|nr:GatB/YqeY domain-containing protein [Chloroflexota bacterium]
MTDDTGMRDRVEADYKAALKARDSDTVSTLRMLKAAIQNAEIVKRAPLTEDEALAVLRREAKVRRESRDEFERGGRQDLAARERTALDVLNGYLPAELDEDQLRTMINLALAELTPEQRDNPRAALGPLIKKVMAQTGGRAEGGTVSAMARSALSEGR